MGGVWNSGGPHGNIAGVLVALAAGLFACSNANEYDYVSFQSDIGSYQSGRFYTKPPQCVAIPADLRLCHSVGYDKMVLPNLLDHETMAEVKQQASSWVPLLNKNCHIGTQVFLCSLFAPVCLDRPIYPCRWLCEAVRDSCEPVMQFFGFYWPEMLKCDQFPQDDVCIAMTTPNATEASKPQGTAVCPPCDNEMKSDAIIEHLCASEFGKEMFWPFQSFQCTQEWRNAVSHLHSLLSLVLHGLLLLLSSGWLSAWKGPCPQSVLSTGAAWSRVWDCSL
uniref:Secreted frizzled related protein 1 n=1 Tax=Pelusios castaneus TaxID=367368 RepID=A0A8C8SS51_9SAUR